MAAFDENAQLDNQITYQEYQGSIPPAPNITNLGGSAPVISINGVDGPVVNFSGGITGYSFTTGSNPITLTGAAASIRETGGPTVLTFGLVTDGEFLKRVGTTVVSASVTGGITQLTGDVTAGPGSGSQVATIANDAVTNAKLANMTAPTFKLRTTAGAGDPEDGTPTQATAMLDVMVGDSGAGGTKGLAPAPAAGDAAAGKFLKADGSYAVPPGTGSSGITELTGDVTAGPGSGSQAATIASNAVTTSKINNGAVTEAKITLANNTTNNVSTAAHGFTPILPNDATKFLDGTGAYSVPPGTIAGGAPTAQQITLPWFLGANGTNLGVGTVNRVFLFRVCLLANITVNFMGVRNSTTVNGKHWGIGLYNTAGTTLVLDSGPMAMGAAASNLSAAPSAVAVPAGSYWLAWTCDDATLAATLRSAVINSDLAASLAGGSTAVFAHATNTSTAGQLPATTGTINTDVAAVDGCPWVVLKN